MENNQFDKKEQYQVSSKKFHYTAFENKTKNVKCQKCKNKQLIKFPAKLDIKMATDIMKRALD